MKRWIFPALLLPLVAACTSQPELSDPIARGERDFNGLGCVKCHAIGNVGHSWGPDLTMLGFRKSEQWIDSWLKDPHSWNQKTLMPNFNLRPKTRADLVAFLSAQKGQAWKEKPWRTEAARLMPAAERGKLIFDAVGCVSCHGKDGYGGYPNNNVPGGLIPSLTKISEGYSKSELHEKIKNGSTPPPNDVNSPAPLLQMPKWGESLESGDIDAVVEYLFSLAPKSAAAGKDDF
ncbi:MAG: c-type cytochrome [Elusimicrobiota bacterium]